MSESCPSHLDADGKSLWEQCAWIISGGAVDASVALQLQALAIRRELRLEAARNCLCAETASRLRDMASRIGPARMPESIRAEIEEMANLYASWARGTK